MWTATNGRSGPLQAALDQNRPALVLVCESLPRCFPQLQQLIAKARQLEAQMEADEEQEEEEEEEGEGGQCPRFPSPTSCAPACA